MRTRRRTSGRGLAAVVLAGAACLLVAACSAETGYPAIFAPTPDVSAPRAETQLSPVQVQQATEDLISERNHLTAEAQGSTSGTSPTSAAPVKNLDKKSVKKPAKKPAKNRTVDQHASGSASADADAGSQAAGAAGKQ